MGGAGEIERNPCEPFPEAQSQQSIRRENCKARPDGIRIEAHASDGPELADDRLFEGEEDLETNLQPKDGLPAVQARPRSLSAYSHTSFRRLYGSYAEGRCPTGAHRRSSKSAAVIEPKIPLIPSDDVEPRFKDDKTDKTDSLPLLVGIDQKLSWVFAHIIPKKGHDAHAVESLGSEFQDVRQRAQTCLIL